MIKAELPLYLPNVAYVNTAYQNALSDARVRIMLSRDSVFNHINRGIFKEIVIVDGSNTLLFSAEEISQFYDRGVVVEQIKFQQNKEEVLNFGKWQGEMQINKFAIENSELLNISKGFYKITPRYTVANLENIILNTRKYDTLFFNYNLDYKNIFNQYTCTAFYKCTFSVYKNYLEDAISECSLDKHGYLESIFNRNLFKNKNKMVSCDFPIFEGIGGTYARPIPNRFYYLRNYFSNKNALAFTV